jgi:aryl-alcohol dehydrogenase-like predicted oxidoreductase
MIYNKLGTSDIKVSKICLGTMTFGEQNTQEQAFEQMDYAWQQGVNFFDTAEMYSVPGRLETQGSTEKIIGNWLQKNNIRNQLVLATKATGKGVKYIRNNPNFSAEHLNVALEGSLNRLQTNYIDLYQLHWPERENNKFGVRTYPYGKNDEYEERFLESIETLSEFIKQGKIKHWGLSNESPWGVMKYLHYCEKYNLPKPISIQNAYSLNNRLYEYGLSEITDFEGIGLLAYSPLAFGSLSGKYLNNQEPIDARLIKYPIFKRFLNEQAQSATADYKKIADSIGLSVAELALAFVFQQKFVHSTIIGATSLNQLKQNIGAINISLSSEIVNEINKVYNVYQDCAV